jgi:hypothetical protein
MNRLILLPLLVVTLISLNAKAGIKDTTRANPSYGHKYRETNLHYENKTRKKLGISMNLGCDIIPHYFNDFTDLLKTYNTDDLTKSNATLILGLTGFYKKFWFGLIIGISYLDDNNNDSLKIQVNTTLYELNFGYEILNSRNFRISPVVALKLYKYRLQNAPKSNIVNLVNYLNSRDLDIRIDQALGFAGLNLAYKLYNRHYKHSNYYTIGIYGGYIFKLNFDPWIYSSLNTLSSNKPINYDHYNLGFYIAVNYE